MAEPIDLAALRAGVERAEQKAQPLGQYLVGYTVPPTTLHALIETVEAAQRLTEHIHLNGGCHVECPEHDLLDDALARFPTGPPS